jgi:metal-responsive CopG/Arc/MetJ family transcriptional regulator
MDPTLFDAVERVRRTTGETRSAVLARAVRMLVAADRHRTEVAQYVAAYRRLPETPAEARAARTIARRVVADLPWDDDEAR